MGVSSSAWSAHIPLGEGEGLSVRPGQPSIIIS